MRESSFSIKNPDLFEDIHYLLVYDTSNGNTQILEHYFTEANKKVNKIQYISYFMNKYFFFFIKYIR